eukprot:3306156-Prymnesium_polylepis.2
MTTYPATRSTRLVPVKFAWHLDPLRMRGRARQVPDDGAPYGTARARRRCPPRLHCASAWGQLNRPPEPLPRP